MSCCAGAVEAASWVVAVTDAGALGRVEAASSCVAEDVQRDQVSSEFLLEERGARRDKSRDSNGPFVTNEW